MNDAGREGQEARVLLLAPTVAELTCAVFARAGIACLPCFDQVQLCEQLTAGAGAVVMAEEAVHVGDSGLAEWLGRQPPWSDLPVLILARAGVHSVAVAGAMEALGNVTILERSARAAALVSAVRSALRARKRQYQLREQLLQHERAAEQLDMAMAAAHAGSWQFNLTTGEFIASDRAIELHGLPSGTQLNHERALACVHPDDRASIDAALRLTFDSGQTFRHEHRVLRPDGSVRWVSSHAERRGEGGQTFVIGHVQDISERKQAELRLRASEEFNRSLMDGSSDCVKVMDTEGRLLSMNTPGQRLMEIDDFGPLCGNEWTTLWPPASHDEARRAVNSARGGESCSFQAFCPTAKGNPRWWDVAVSPVRDAPDGPVVRLLSVSRDITKRKRAEQTLAERSALLTGVLEGTTDVVFVKDLNGRLLLANAAFAAAARSTPEQLVGKTDEDWFGPDVAAAVRQQDETVIAGGSPMQFEETVPVAGEARSFHTLKAPLRDGSSRIVGILGIGRDITERKQAEKALEASEHRLRLTLEAAAIGLWDWDVATDVVTWSPECCVIHGMEPGDFDGTAAGFDRLLHPDDRSRVWAMMRAAVDGRTKYESEFRIVCPNGEVRWVANTGRVMYDQNSTVKMVGTVTNITVRKQAMDELRQSEARFRAGMEAVSDIVWTNDAKGMMSGEQVAWGRFTGQDREAYQGYGWSRAVHPDDAQPTIDAWQTAVAGKRTFAFEHRVRRHDGQWRLCSIRAVPVLDALGDISEWVGVHSDITDRKQAEEALRASEARLGGILLRSPAGIVQTDAEGCITLVNPRWCEMLGYPEAELLGRNIVEITHPSFVAPTTAAFARLGAGGPDFQIEKAYSRKDGSVLRAQSNVAALRSPAGQFLGLIAVVVDIAERLRSEEELRRLAAELSEADSRKDVFLATLAHELRNPLAPIRHGLQVLKQTRNDAAAVEQVRAMMDRQLSQLVRLVDDLLDVSRITQGKVDLRKERVDLKSVIDAAAETSRPAIEQAGHDLAVVLPDEPVFVDGDATRLAQVVSNLLHNSAKYTHRGGHIQVAAWREGGTAVVSVKDDGIGIPPAMIGRVFEMFTQVDRTLEKTTGGLGIGLSLVKELLVRHGGTVEAKSDGEGMGSEFVVRLPVADASAGPDWPNRPTSEVVPSALRRILVVDDNVDAADSLGQLLETFGNEVRTANDGEAGIAAAAQFRPDVVLMDIGMPKLNGYEAARRIRQHPWGRTMVLVALTGWGLEEDRKKSAEAGFDHHLVKPVELDALTKLMSGSSAL